MILIPYFRGIFFETVNIQNKAEKDLSQNIVQTIVVLISHIQLVRFLFLLFFANSLKYNNYINSTTNKPYQKSLSFNFQNNYSQIYGSNN